MLNNGLKYVIPCQSRFQRESVEETLKKQYEHVINVKLESSSFN